jgi:hypothetical protein
MTILRKQMEAEAGRGEVVSLTPTSTALYAP